MERITKYLIAKGWNQITTNEFNSPDNRFKVYVQYEKEQDTYTIISSLTNTFTDWIHCGLIRQYKTFDSIKQFIDDKMYAVISLREYIYNLEFTISNPIIYNNVCDIVDIIKNNNIPL